MHLDIAGYRSEAHLVGRAHPLWDRQVRLEQKMRPLFEVAPPAMMGTPISQSSVREAIRRGLARAKHDHLARFYRPTVIPPRAWTIEEDGGYWTLDPFYPRCPPLGPRFGGRSDIVATALNSFQAVPWRINQRVLAVVSEAKRFGLEMPGLPQEDLEDQEPPIDSPERYEQWQCCEVLAAAYEYAGYDRFYFPHALNVWSEFAPIPRHLQPHGSDLARALLEFADARTVTQPQAENSEGGDDGHHGLARHLSSCFGFLGDGGTSPCAWVCEREGLFRQIAAAPFEHRAWVGASKPWQALAAVFEWVAYLDAVDRFKSRLPISTESHPLWQRQFSHHQDKILATIQAAQASGIVLTGLKPEHLATHAADVGQAMSILEEADKVGVQAERLDSLKQAERFARLADY